MFVFEAISGSKEDFIRPKMGANKRGGGELFFSCEYEDAVDQQGPSTLFRSQKKIRIRQRSLKAVSL